MSLSARESKHSLSQDAQAFDEQGFVGPFTAFAVSDMDEPRDLISRQVLNAPSVYSSYPTQSRHLDSLTIWKLFNAPAIVEKLVELFGEDLMVWASFIFDKGGARPELVGEIPWHQDKWFWGYESIENVSAWIALTPSTLENGCVEIIPGSHRRQLEHVRTRQADHASWFGGVEAIPTDDEVSRSVAMEMQPGQFFIFTESTLHRSRPNRSGGPRLGVSMRVARPDLRSNRSEPCVMLHGQDRYRVNAYCDPPAGEPLLLVPLDALQSSESVHMDGPWPGIGWHGPERYGGGEIRWTGPDRISWVDLRWRGRGDGHLTCTISHAAESDLLPTIVIRVNDDPVALSWRSTDAGTELSGTVSSEALLSRNGRVRVEIELPRVSTAAMGAVDNPETRALGVAVAGLSITEVSAH